LRAALVSALGVRWAGAPGRSAEVVGVRPELLGAFSTRGADIRRHMHEAGARSSRGARVAWAATRPAKSTSAPFADLAARWQRRAAVVGVPLELELGGARSPRAVLDEHRFAGVLSLTPHGGARRRDVVTAFSAAARAGVSAPAAARLVAQWVPPGPVGVAEPLQSRRAVMPANHHLRLLGPRPVDPDEHEVWRDAARAIDAYRDRWGLGRAPAPLGAPANLAALPAAQLADHVRTQRELAVAQARLGWREPFSARRGLGR
jgi:hypothetical protein